MTSLNLETINVVAPLEGLWLWCLAPL